MEDFLQKWVTRSGPRAIHQQRRAPRVPARPSADDSSGGPGSRPMRGGPRRSPALRPPRTAPRALQPPKWAPQWAKRSPNGAQMEPKWAHARVAVVGRGPHPSGAVGRASTVHDILGGGLGALTCPRRRAGVLSLARGEVAALPAARVAVARHGTLTPARRLAGGVILSASLTRTRTRAARLPAPCPTAGPGRAVNGGLG
eukprot:scaffold3761_cov372-Prasinococcus_capsulatus_cf.AAC.8